MAHDPDMQDEDNKVKPLPAEVTKMFRRLQQKMVEMQKERRNLLDVGDWDEKLKRETANLEAQLAQVKEQQQAQQKIWPATEKKLKEELQQM